jgi:hypothetical protein
MIHAIQCIQADVALASKAQLKVPAPVLEKFEEIVNNLRKALFMYEVRAYRRKQEDVNQKKGTHDDTVHPREFREFPFEDVPFGWDNEIELWPIGEDGHVIPPKY